MAKKFSSRTPEVKIAAQVSHPLEGQKTPKVKETKASPVKAQLTPIKGDDFPNVDRLYQLFTLGGSKLPIVETVSYSPNVTWLQGRPAWIADYASYFNTSRHFIARSLNGKPDYINQNVSLGSKFNVFRKDKDIEFHLLVDLIRCKMAFYYLDKGSNERVLLKTYTVGIGRPDSNKVSGFLTPVGTYSLGGKIAIYKPGITGFFQDKTVELIRIFGTRWIPFEKEIADCSEPAKGFGLHGSPWIEDKEKNQLVENRASIGVFESDGCIRLNGEDIEELFAIIITKPSFIHIVRDFHEAVLPGTEVATPST